MARIRTIKPEFWEDEELSKIPMQARLVFIGIWNFADDQGVIYASLKYIKSKIFPYDETLREQQFKTWIDALVDARMLIPFSFDSKEYFLIRTFQSHQLIDKRYTKHIVPSKKVTEILAGLTYSEITTLSHSDHNQNTSRKGREVDMEVDMESKCKIEFKKIFDEVVESERWLQDMAMHRGVEFVYVEKKLLEFLEDIRLKEDWYKGTKEVKKHFLNWLKIEISKEKNSAKKENNGTIGTKTGQQHPLQELRNASDAVLSAIANSDTTGGD